MGRPILAYLLDALDQAGFARKDVIFVSGYAEAAVRQSHPELTFVQNSEWAKNNILLSLFKAEAQMEDGFISTYADIVYEPGIVQRLKNAPEDLVLGCDTEWRRRYLERSDHPETDAEKLTAQARRVTGLSRQIPSEQATGEFIGVLKATAQGARSLRASFARARSKFAGRPYREGRHFERAYLIDLLSEMLEDGTPIHCENTPGGYMEIDTVQDLALAPKWWSAWIASTSSS